MVLLDFMSKSHDFSIPIAIDGGINPLPHYPQGCLLAERLSAVAQAGSQARNAQVDPSSSLPSPLSLPLIVIGKEGM